jgi:hypothetical protein
VIHQAIYIPDLDHHLLSPMQCRVADVVVNDCPKFLTANPTEETHCLIARDEGGTRVTLPLGLQGVTSVLNVHSISEAEWIREAAPRITLTNRDLHWNPNSSIYEEQESNKYWALLLALPATGLDPITSSIRSRPSLPLAHLISRLMTNLASCWSAMPMSPSHNCLSVH